MNTPAKDPELTELSGRFPWSGASVVVALVGIVAMVLVVRTCEAHNGADDSPTTTSAFTTGTTSPPGPALALARQLPTNFSDAQDWREYRSKKWDFEDGPFAPGDMDFAPGLVDGARASYRAGPTGAIEIEVEVEQYDSDTSRSSQQANIQTLSDQTRTADCGPWLVTIWAPTPPGDAPAPGADERIAVAQAFLNAHFGRCPKSSQG